MAAITTVIVPTQSTKRVRTQAAVASGTFTDWVAVPPWAKAMTVYHTVLTVSTNNLLSLLTVDPIAKDDGTVIDLAAVSGTGVTAVATTAANLLVVHVGQDVGGSTNEVTNSATASSVNKIVANLPALVGIRTVTTGAGTGSWNTTVHFRG